MGLYSFKTKKSSPKTYKRSRRRRRSYKGGNFLKGKGILSGLAKLIPFAGNAISHVIEKQGYGRRRRRCRKIKCRRRRRRRGGSFKDLLQKLPRSVPKIVNVGGDPKSWGPPRSSSDSKPKPRLLIKGNDLISRGPIRRGKGFGDTIKKIGKYMHDHKVLSNGIKVINSVLNPWSTVANIASNSLNKVGLGRRRRRRYRRRR